MATVYLHKMLLATKKYVTVKCGNSVCFTQQVRQQRNVGAFSYLPHRKSNQSISLLKREGQIWDTNVATSTITIKYMSLGKLPLLQSD